MKSTIEEVKDYYTKSSCPFCKQLLTAKYSGQYVKLDEDCRNAECKHSFFRMPDAAYFYINQYKFKIDLVWNKTIIDCDDMVDTLIYPKALIINESNYLQQVEKIKTLQLFS